MTDLEKLNAQRERNGMLPLTEMPKSAEEEKMAKEKSDKEEAEKKEKEAADKKKADEEAEAARIEAEKKKDQPQEIDDEQVLAYLQKKKGLKIDSFDALKPTPTSEELKKEQEQRDAEKLSWALKNGKFKKQDFENYITDSKDPKNLIYNSYAAKVKKANPEITNDEIQDQFKERFGLDKDPESWQYQQGQEELNLMSTQLLNKQYGAILNLDSDYSTYEKGIHQQQSVQAKIIANAPAYKRDVENVFSGLTTYKTTIDKEEFEVPIPADFVERAKAYFLHDNTASEQIQRGWTKENIEEVANNMLLIENRNYFNQKIAEQYHKNKAKGTHGLAAPLGRRQEQEITDEKQKKAAERHGAVIPTATN